MLIVTVFDTVEICGLPM